MSPQMQEFFELMQAAEAAHKYGLVAAFDILMAEVYEAFGKLPRDDRAWLEQHADV